MPIPSLHRYKMFVKSCDSFIVRSQCYPLIVQWRQPSIVIMSNARFEERIEDHMTIFNNTSESTNNNFYQGNNIEIAKEIMYLDVRTIQHLNIFTDFDVGTIIITLKLF